MKTNYNELLKGNHGRVICKVCSQVLMSCRCMNCGDNVIETTCDICKSIKEDVKFVMDLEVKLHNYFAAVTNEQLIEDLIKAGFDSNSLKTIIEGMKP